MLVERLRRRFYGAEHGDRYDGTKAFYAMVRENCSPDMRVLNLGAGPATENPVRIFKGQVREVVGADVDRCVFDNPELDRAVLIENGVFPLEDNSFDLIYSDYVLEHVEHPQQFLSEVHRVLKPGGSYYFRTPNKLHYVAMVSAYTPHWFHEKVANFARANAEGSQEPWPTFYRMNSPGALRSLAKAQGFSTIELRMVEMEPSYLAFAAPFFALGIAYERLVNGIPALQGMRANIFGRLVK